MEKLLIVDGCNLLFQMFCGMPARILNSQGKAIQGIYRRVAEDDPDGAPYPCGCAL